jgi:hypothetical protein
MPEACYSCSSVSAKTPGSASEIDVEAIREQLERMLAHPVFKVSKRCQILLRYLVEYAARGETVHPKERTLGTEVFGRSPDYDTNSDPVIRTTCSDIRKRIAQYYHDPEHEGELRIDLPLGSYLLAFHYPESQGMDSPVEERVAPAQFMEVRYPRHKTIPRAFVALAVAVAVVVLLAFSVLLYFRGRTPIALDRFWSPVLVRSGNISLCIPVSSSNAFPKSHPAGLETLGMPAVGLTDYMALTNMVQFLGNKNVRFNVKFLSFAYSDVANPSEGSLMPSLAELRQGPVIFIGNSDWSMRLVSRLRFHIKTDDAADLFWVEDSQNPLAKKWSGKIDQPYQDYTQDYAIISRFYDQSIGQTVVVVSGLGLHATAAAAEFVTNPAYMNQIAAGNSTDWQKNNLQIIISTKIAGQSWGQPQILAKYFW